MATEVGTVTVPMQITINAGSPAREVGTVTTDAVLSITADPRPIGASGLMLRPVPSALRDAVARALREAADTIEREQSEPLDSDRLYLDR